MKTKREKRFKKIKWPSFVKDMKEAVAEHIVTVLVVLIFAALIFFLVSSFLHGSRYFSLKTVETRGPGDHAQAVSTSSELLRMYRNVNLFDIDIRAISKYLAGKYQDARAIVVKLTPPDRLTVIIEMRKPVAILANSRRYSVDDEGVILVETSPDRAGDLPVINGVDQRYLDRTTRRNASRNLGSALELLREFKRSRYFPNYQITTIDAGDISRLSFSLNDEFEVKIGYENLRERLGVLRNTLKDTRLVKDRIKYIDVRFEDVSIGTK